MLQPPGAADERTQTHLPSSSPQQMLTHNCSCWGSVPLSQKDITLLDFPDFYFIFLVFFRDGIGRVLAGRSRRLRELLGSPGWRSCCSETQQEAAWVSQLRAGAVRKEPFLRKFLFSRKSREGQLWLLLVPPGGLCPFLFPLWCVFVPVTSLENRIK